MNEWIRLKGTELLLTLEKCKDEIPVICFDGHLVFAAFYDGEGFYIDNDDLDNNYFDDITHFMFMPKPPEVK